MPDLQPSTAPIRHAAPHTKASTGDHFFDLASGRIRARIHGPLDRPLAIGVPGLSANCFAFHALGAGLEGRTLAAIDLRGRGRSPAGPKGSHGWENHARDVLAVADQLGAQRFDFIGHSMGAFIGLVVANLAPERLRRLVLIDAVGVPDPRAMQPIFAAAQRLGAVHRTPDEFLGLVKASGAVPWSPFWEAHYREDLIETPGGVRQRADRDAVLEDVIYAAGTQVRDLWPGVGVPTLLIRAGIPLVGGGEVVTEDDRVAFLETASRARAIEIDANHYGVMDHPGTAAAVAEFLR